MGNSTHLFLGDYCEFEANNCLPVTWLALFDTQEFIIERYQEDTEETIATGYRTNQSKALKRVESTIEKLQGHTPVWGFLRPLEILQEELKRCPQDATLNLDLTQLWAVNESYSVKVTQAAGAFGKMLGEVSGQKEHDILLLSELVNEFSLGNISSVADLSPEDRMFVLIGTYWGNAEREEMYSLEYFDEAYWTTE